MSAAANPEIPPGREVATLAGGCFWCLEAVYERLRGVDEVTSGYTGGEVAEPTYQQVCSGTTGHAEAVRITYDPEAISYRELLEVFFAIHDPTTRDRQGADVGTQYRSVIFVHDEEQERAARTIIEELAAARVFSDPIVTEIRPAARFYVAESYHQEYFRHNSQQPYCQYVITPKLAKLHEKFRAKLKN